MSKKEKIEAQNPDIAEAAVASANTTPDEEDIFAEHPPIKKDKATLITDLVEMGRNKGKLTEADVREGMREVRLALLEADGTGESGGRLYTGTSYVVRYRMCVYRYRSGFIHSFSSSVPWCTASAEWAAGLHDG